MIITVLVPACATILLIVALTRWAVQTIYQIHKWNQQNIKFMMPLPLIGNMLPNMLNKLSLAEMLQEIYEKYPTERYVGFFQFGTPVLMIRDPQMAKSITTTYGVKHFRDHYSLNGADWDAIWSKSLFAANGDYWIALRSQLEPLFSTKRMHLFFPSILECATQYHSSLEQVVRTECTERYNGNMGGIVEMEIKDFTLKYANDVIAKCVFDMNLDSIQNPHNEFLSKAKNMGNFSGLRRLKFLLYSSAPGIVRLFDLKIVNLDIGRYFGDLIKQTLHQYTTTVMDQPNNFLQMYLQRKGCDWTENELTAQALTFFFGGLESVSNIISFAMYELAMSPSVQSKLYNEFNRVNKDELTYDGFLKLKYAECVVLEVLRKWPQAVCIDRKCVKDIRISVKDDKEFIDLQKGDVLVIPVFPMQRDSHYYPNPNKFDPSRFQSSNGYKSTHVFMTFGSGARRCVAMHFAMLEIKLLLYKIVKTYEIVTVPRTVSSIQIKADCAILSSKLPIWVGFKLRQ